MRQTNSPGPTSRSTPGSAVDGVGAGAERLVRRRGRDAMRSQRRHLRLAALGEDLVEQRQVVDPRVGEVDGVEQPGGDGVVGRRLQRRGDRVERELEVLPRPGDRRVGEAAGRDLLDAVVDDVWAAAASPLASSIASARPAMRSRTTSGCSSRNSVVTMRWVVTNLPSGQRSRLVDEHVAAALLDQARGPRLGHPRPVDGAGLERGQRVGVVLRRDVTSPPPLVSVA